MLFFAALLLIMARFLSIWAGTPFPIDLVTSDSMSPALMEGDIVAWTPTNIEDINVGDVIVFRSRIAWPDEKIVVHRVSAIEKKASGTILLETKGDNNKWTDQAGPHIPEPYIRESHLMGKVVSVGQQPLKIPLIGHIGLWINQGLDMISQSSSSKDSTSYVAIFAPLTISVVVLVILLFVIPEKARNFKEKIRLNIFGRKPIQIKRTFVLFIVAYIIFLSVIHTFAHDTSDGSVGINENGEDSSFNFGNIQPGSVSTKKDIQIINPSTMAVKGVIFGTGGISDYVSTRTFDLDRGQISSAQLYAKAPKDAKTGSYTGDIMIYSSPFWLIFPDEFIQGVLNLNSGMSVIILDFIIAVILTSITMAILIGFTFFEDKLIVWSIDSSWQKTSKIFIKKHTVKRIKKSLKRVRRTVSKGALWVLKLDFSDRFGNDNFFKSIGKPLIAASLTLPVLFFISDSISAMIVAVFITGVFAYFISCKIRRKIVITVFLTAGIAVAHMIIHSNLIILSKEPTTVELMALSSGVVGIYLLILTLCLIPLSLVVWILTRVIRNVKEQKDPLLSLEGSCDL